MSKDTEKRWRIEMSLTIFALVVSFGSLLISVTQMRESIRSDAASKRFEYVKAIFARTACHDSARRCGLDQASCSPDERVCPVEQDLAIRMASAQALVRLMEEPSHRNLLSHASLSWVDFGGQNLLGVDFYGADLRCANFKNADLKGVKFMFTDLRGSLLPDNLSHIRWNPGVICPDGSILGKCGETCEGHTLERLGSNVCNATKDPLSLPSEKPIRLELEKLKVEEECP
ncbi:MAG: pentapeptide repeat-containing protein [Leptospirales bacterium]|nr:pentapeptide repeat-containing protein [Leptospirales bacterium]